MAAVLKYTFLEKTMNDYGRDLAKELQSIVPVKTGADIATVLLVADCSTESLAMEIYIKIYHSTFLGIMPN